MIQSLNFGDVFRHKESPYIYLAPEKSDNIYVAKILNKELTDISEAIARKCTGGGAETAIFLNSKQNLLCYIILNTEEFKERAANYAIPPESCPIIDKIGSLNKSDKNKLKKAIIQDTDVVYDGLKDEMRKLS